MRRCLLKYWQAAPTPAVISGISISYSHHEFGTCFATFCAKGAFRALARQLGGIPCSVIAIVQYSRRLVAGSRPPLVLLLGFWRPCQPRQRTPSKSEFSIRSPAP